MYMSKRGICYTLSSSPYFVQYFDIKLFFSSKNYLEKFNETFETICARLQNEMLRRFGIDYDMSLLALLKAYRMVEKRGFYITVGGEPVTCQDQLLLCGTKLHVKH